MTRSHHFSRTNKPAKLWLWGISKMRGRDRGLSNMCFSVGCVSSGTHNLQAFFLTSYLVHNSKRQLWSQTFLAATVETGNKNRDDFHCMQMRLVKSMWFILAMTEVMRVVDLVLVWLFGYDVIFPESTMIIMYSYTSSRTWKCYSGGNPVSYCYDAITGTLLLNRFDIVQIPFVVCI